MFESRESKYLNLGLKRIQRKVVPIKYAVTNYQQQ